MTGTAGGVTPVPYPDEWNEIASGETTIERSVISSNAVSTGTGTLRLVYWTVRKSEITTQVNMISGGTAAAATPTLVRAGLWTIAANGDGTLVASIPSDTALFAAGNTAYARAWSVPYAKVAGQRLAFGILVVTAAAAPSLFGQTFPLGAPAALAPRITGSIGGQADLPATFLAASIGQSSGRAYAEILP